MDGKKNSKFRKIIAALFLIPCMLFMVGCGDNNNDGETKSDVICTVVFYTGISNEFNVPKQEVFMGEKIRKPINFPNRYFDEQKQKTLQFVGWYNDQSMTDEHLWKFETDLVKSDMTLYALWEEVSV